MSNLTNVSDLTNITDPKQFMVACSQAVQAIQSIINGQLEFDTNLLTQTVQVTFLKANQPQAIKHNLNKSTVKYIVVDKDAPCDIYHNSVNDLQNTIYLKSTVAGVTVSLVLF